MVVQLGDFARQVPCYVGVRMSAEEFLALPETLERYELVDGVVVMSPAASFGHQHIASEILFQIRAYLESTPIGCVVADVDVRLRAGLVYRPDVVFLTTAKAARAKTRIAEPPDLIVEFVSPDSRQRDALTRRQDYEAAGVGEYWTVDAELNTFQFFVLRNGAFAEVPAAADRYAATILGGFELDLARIRRLF